MIEVASAPIARQPLERILAAYDQKATVAGVLFLAEDTAVAAAIQAAFIRLGLARTVHVQHIRIADALIATSRRPTFDYLPFFLGLERGDQHSWVFIDVFVWRVRAPCPSFP